MLDFFLIAFWFGTLFAEKKPTKQKKKKEKKRLVLKKSSMSLSSSLSADQQFLTHHVRFELEDFLYML